MDRAQAEVYAIHMLKFLRERYPALGISSLEVGRDDKQNMFWCKVHRNENEPTHGGGYLFTVAYLERTAAA